MKDLSSKIYITDRKPFVDSRGMFLKVIDGKEENNPYPCEVYITTAKSGETKGGHYHKEANEWFTIIKGQAEATLIDIITEQQIKIVLKESNPITLYVPKNVAHFFLNNSEEEFVLIAYTDKVYDSRDTISYKILT